MRHISDIFRCAGTSTAWPRRARIFVLALLLGGAVPGVSDPAAANTDATTDVADVTRIVDHLINTDMLDQLAKNPDGLSIRLPDNRRVYTVKLEGERLLIRAETGQTYQFLLKSVL